MYRFYTASKDTTLYSLQPNQNTGRDEILEISKTYVGGLEEIAHSLIKFDTNQISSSITNEGVILTSAELIITEDESSEVPTTYTIFAHPISQSWDMGTGTKFDEISTENSTWDSRKTNVNWLSGSYALNTTGSIIGSGGTWYTTYSASQSFEYESVDLALDVIVPINAWLSGSIPNEGWILKLSDTKEADNNDYGTLKYFSKDTNTIYQPKIRVGWDDSSFITGSLTELTADIIKVTFRRLKKVYKVNSTPIIRVFGREKYPLKTYTNLYSYNDIKFLPITTYYQIRDAITNEIVIPFGEYSKVSCDENGNYFNLNLKSWNTNRSYYIEIKTERNGIIEYFTDDNLTFTVET